MPDSHADAGACGGNISKPVQSSRRDGTSEQLIACPDDDRPVLGTDRYDVKRHAGSAGQAAPLSHGETREPIVLSDNLACGRDEGPPRQRRRIGAEAMLEDAG